MNISVKWLKSYVNIDGYSIKELAEKISIAGVEVEDIHYLAQGSNLVVGYVQSRVAHPNSDHLSVCQVEIGEGRVSQIVCGAPNVRAGQKVIVALPGANLPAINVIIQKSVVRDVESNGMICSLLELGVEEKYLTEDQKAGIEVLDSTAIIGSNPLELLGLDDTILEIKPTPNRGDVLSLYSFALDVGAILNRDVKQLNIRSIKGKKDDNLSVKSITPLCKAINLKRVKGIKVKESPIWLKQLLVASGIRSINNVVDIGNYVMILLGQPLHMYDASKLTSSSLIVKSNYDGKVVALDDQEYQVNQEDVVITNDNKVECIAGVMGSKSSMVDGKTKEVVIEAAIFDRIAVRKTSKRLLLQSDSSTRFVKGVDKNRLLLALDLAASLMVELADAKAVYETISYSKLSSKDNIVKVRTEQINKLLGSNFSNDDIKSVFNRLKFNLVQKGSSFAVTIPTYRNDITIWQDLAEEVIRILGFDNLKTTYPQEIKGGFLSEKQRKIRLIREYLIANGLNETMNYTLINEKEKGMFDVISNDESINVLMPMTEDRHYLRTNLALSLIKTIKYNNSFRTSDISMFEISEVYSKKGVKVILGIALSKKTNEVKWLGTPDSSFYTTKGLIEGVLSLLGIEPSRYNYDYIERDNKCYHPGKSAYLMSNRKKIGVLGQVHPSMEKRLDIDDTYLAEIDLTALLDMKVSRVKFAQPCAYPSINRDIALVVKDEVLGNDIIKTIKKCSKGIIEAVEVFDVYKGEHVKAGYKSIAVSITFQSKEKTLTDLEVLPVYESVLITLEKELLAELRK